MTTWPRRAPASEAANPVPDNGHWDERVNGTPI